MAIVGGGPAGLAAGIYLGRFLRSVTIFDAGDARARFIPCTRNCPGFPEGISGVDLLARLRTQATSYGAEIVDGLVLDVAASHDRIELTTTQGLVTSSYALIATGIVDNAPAMPGIEAAVLAGMVRLCPVCDAYEVQGRHVGVVGPESAALKEARFLRHFTPRVTILCNYPEDFSDAARRQAAAHNIDVWDRVDDLIVTDTGLDVVLADGMGSARPIDAVYAAMGCEVRSELATAQGAQTGRDGYILVSKHMETTAPRIYAIGDVVDTLNQIAVAFGQAAQAAAHIHNRLSEAIDRKAHDIQGLSAAAPAARRLIECSQRGVKSISGLRR